MQSFLGWLQNDTAGLLTLAVLGIAGLLFMIIRLKVEPFVALLVAGLLVAVVGGIPVADIVGTVQESDNVGLIEDGVGGILGSVAVVIGLGSMIGAMLEASGGAEVLASRLISFFGERRAPLAMGLCGLIFGIPVFFDIGIFVLAPLVYVAAMRSRRSILIYCLPLLAGLSVMHAFLPPHPGPVAAAGLLHVDLGYLIVFGFVCGIPAWVVGGYFFSRWIGEKLYVPVPEEMVALAREGATVGAGGTGRTSGGGSADLEDAERTPAGPPPVGAGTVAAIIVVPLALILIATVSSVTMPEGMVRSVLEFVGDPVVALTITVLLTTYILGFRRGWHSDDVSKVAAAALKPVGMILLVVGAGGFFGAVLSETGVGEALAGSLSNAGLPLVVLAYVISCGLRIAQGSATVAIITTAGIVQPLVADAGYGQADLALLVIAISAGSIIASHVNDGGFWIVSRYFGIPVKETLQSWTVLETILSVVGFVCAATVSVFV
jgi:gluconate:H+ symporter, GntP family